MLLFTRNIGFKFIAVNEPVLGVCPGVLDRGDCHKFLRPHATHHRWEGSKWHVRFMCMCVSYTDPERKF